MISIIIINYKIINKNKNINNIINIFFIKIKTNKWIKKSYSVKLNIKIIIIYPLQKFLIILFIYCVK